VWSLSDLRRIERRVSSSAPTWTDRSHADARVVVAVQHALAWTCSTRWTNASSIRPPWPRPSARSPSPSGGCTERSRRTGPRARRARSSESCRAAPRPRCGSGGGGDLRTRPAGLRDRRARGGEPKPELYDIAELVAARLPAARPRYLMGVGKPGDLVEAVARGVDLFDCVMPTRNARNGQAFTPDGPLNIENARFRHDPAPLDPACPCEACRRFSRAYLRHLFAARELLGYRLLSLHNLTFYLGLMRQMRERWRKATSPRSGLGFWSVMG